MSFLAAFLIRSLIWRIPGMRLLAAGLGVVIAGAIFLYIFYALGLWRIGKNRNIPLAWLSWIPAASFYVLGAAADDRRTRRFYTVICPVLGILAAVFGLTGLFTPAEAAGVYLLLAGVLAAAAAVFFYMALYWVYAGLVKHPTPLLAVSVIFVFLIPIFLFVLRERLPGGARRVTRPVHGD